MRTQGGRLVVATDRAPITFTSAADRIRMTRGTGGVVTAVRDTALAQSVTWVASAVLPGDVMVARARLRDGALLGNGRLALRLIPMSVGLFDDYRTAFADRILWFIQHGLWPTRISPESPSRIRWLSSRYESAGRRFAEAIAVELHRPGHSGAVLIHDYQLYSVPALVRARIVGAHIAHFSHIPWPALPVWRAALPDDVIERLLRGLLAANVLHFQTQASADAFLSSVDELLPDVRVRGELVSQARGSVLVRARAASVDPASLRPSRREVDRLRSDGRRLIVRVDRADPIKNIPAGFDAFERLLARCPELVGSVRFHARIVPTRVGVPEYARELARIREGARRINARFGADTVRLIERADRQRALAELAAADVVLVNSLADGMDLVAKESAVLGEHSALVLSRRAGAYEELAGGAIGIDPEDVEGTAVALRAALEMSPGETAARSSIMRERVLAWTAHDWLRAQLDDLSEATARRERSAIAS